MKRNFGSPGRPTPGRLDLSAIAPSPATAFVDGKGRALVGFLAVAVILLGLAALGAAVYQLGAHLTLAAIAAGRGR